MILALLLAAGLSQTASPEVARPASQAPQATVAATPVMEVPAQEAAPKVWVGDEDLLMFFQTLCGLGAAAGAGAVALVPASMAMGVLLLFTAGLGFPALLVAGPVGLVLITVLFQAGVAGLAVWAVGNTSNTFHATSALPLAVQKKLPEALASPSTVVGSLVGGGFVAPVVGYAAGALLGVGVGMALAAPMLAAGVLLSNAPKGSFPGVAGLVMAVMAAGAVVALSETLVAPAVAALAWHLSKEPNAPAR